MPIFETTVTCPVHDSFRIRQLAGMFDVPIEERQRRTFCVEIPPMDRPWQIGLIVGPSGSGKSTLARHLFGGDLCEQLDWPADRAVIDCFGDRSIREVTAILTSVGFSSPPAWLCPYHVLSGGERFRCDLARAMSDWIDTRDNPAPGCWSDTTSHPANSPDSMNLPESDVAISRLPIVAFDEFTSVVDRNVAQVGSAAIAKGVRRGLIRCRFVAVTCHYDVEEWLTPDWTIDMAEQRFHWRLLQRPSIELEIYRCDRAAWRLFKHHHYLSGDLNPTAQCFVAMWRGEPVSFCAALPQMGRKKFKRFTRLVTLPDYQGIGIGTRLIECIAQRYRDAGYRVGMTLGHHALIAHARRSPLWRCSHIHKTGAGGPGQERFSPGYRGSVGRSVVSFEYGGTPPHSAPEPSPIH